MLKHLYIILHCNIYKYRLYGLINLVAFIILFAGGLSIMFLSEFSAIPKDSINFGLIFSILSFIFLFGSIYYFIEFGKIQGRIETTAKWRKRLNN